MKCACDSGLSQLNRPKKCKEYLKQVEDVLLIERFADDGSKNAIDLSTIPVPESALEDMFNAPNVHNRLHIVAGIKDLAQESQDGQTKEFDDGTSVQLSDGNLQITFTIPETNVDFLCGIGSAKCVNPDMFIRTVSGQLVGYANPDTIATEQKLYPLPVGKITIKESPFSTYSDVAMVEVTVDFLKQMNYCNWIVMKSDEYEWDEAKQYEAAGAILKETGTPSSTSVKVEVTQEGQGILGNSQPVTGLQIADFSFEDGGSVTPTSVSESPSGTYDFSFSSLPASSILNVNLEASSGYVGKTLKVTIP